MRVLTEASSVTEAFDAAAAPELAAVYREHAMTVARWVARLGGPLLDVEDVTHEVFLKVQRALPHFRGEAQLSTWLFSLTANTVRTRRRTERFRRFFRAPLERGLEVADDSELAPAQLEQQDREQQLYRVLDHLSDRDRQVLVLFELEGRSGREVADLLDVQLERVWVLRHRARARFAEHMKRELGGGE
ncbi:MAG: sigma-70 family RNA polymerase sigma factor [Archangiaceae bacterium]|nr:sigma-70 family RNA polymerase sigma factor [Archangiaceae bacterium]